MSRIGSLFVQKLTRGEHRIRIVPPAEQTSQALIDCLEQGYIHLTFPDTQRGTILHVQLDPNETREAIAQSGLGSKILKVKGRLTLDYQRVECLATIDLNSLEGVGRLVRLRD